MFYGLAVGTHNVVVGDVEANCVVGIGALIPSPYRPGVGLTR